VVSPWILAARCSTPALPPMLHRLNWSAPADKYYPLGSNHGLIRDFFIHLPPPLNFFLSHGPRFQWLIDSLKKNPLLKTAFLIFVSKYRIFWRRSIRTWMSVSKSIGSGNTLPFDGMKQANSFPCSFAHLPCWGSGLFPPPFQLHLRFPLFFLVNFLHRAAPRRRAPSEVEFFSDTAFPRSFSSCSFYHPPNGPPLFIQFSFYPPGAAHRGVRIPQSAKPTITPVFFFLEECPLFPLFLLFPPPVVLVTTLFPRISSRSSPRTPRRWTSSSRRRMASSSLRFTHPSEQFFNGDHLDTSGPHDALLDFQEGVGD